MLADSVFETVDYHLETVEVANYSLEAVKTAMGPSVSVAKVLASVLGDCWPLPQPVNRSWISPASA